MLYTGSAGVTGPNKANMSSTSKGSNFMNMERFSREKRPPFLSVGCRLKPVNLLGFSSKSHSILVNGQEENIKKR